MPQIFSADYFLNATSNDLTPITFILDHSINPC
jgi:hypothetical protein